MAKSWIKRTELLGLLLSAIVLPAPDLLAADAAAPNDSCSGFNVGDVQANAGALYKCTTTGGNDKWLPMPLYLGQTTTACSSTYEGLQRYNPTSQLIEFCNGSAWTSLTSGCPGADVTSGLVGHWKFDAGSGTSAVDSSGNGLTGTLTNGPTWFTTGAYLGNAITFDGVDDYVTIPDPGTGSILDFANGTSITILTWIFFPDNFPTGGSILVKETNASSDTGNYDFFLESGFYYNRLSFDFASSAGSFHAWRGPALPNNAWHHVGFGVTFGTANTARFYLDGWAHPAAVASGTPETTAPLVDNNAIFMGVARYGSSTLQNPLFGRLDDVRIYNRLLTKAEVMQIYQYTSRSCN